MNARWFAPAIVTAALLGWICAAYFPSPFLTELTAVLQTTFLAALKMVIAPLIFFSLLSGTMKLRSSGAMGRLGAVTVGYYLTTSAIAIAIGLIVVFFVHPWTQGPTFETLELPTSSPANEQTASAPKLLTATDSSVTEVLGNLLRAMFVNPFTALADLNILGILTNALLIGLAAALALPKDSPLPRILDDITAIMYRVASWIIFLLPIGLFAIAYQMSERVDLSTLASLAQFAAVVFGATAFHGVIVLPVIAWLATGTTPLALLRAVTQPLLTALFTSSSAATLPLSLAAAKDKLGVDPAKAAFVLPLGATVNMDGTALFEGIAIVYLAYMFGISLDPGSIVVIFFVTMLASAGAPGIPSGSMAGLQVVMLAVGIPLEGIALLLLIERPLDTFRTAVNVEGDLVGSLVAQRWA